MDKPLLIATNNADKVREIQAILGDSGFTCLTMAQAGVSSDPEETGTTFAENALIKAKAAAGACGGKFAVLADDSGLVVDALGGAPGIYSARYAGDHGDSRANNAKLLHALENVPFEERSARFVCALAFIDEDGHVLGTEGTVEGRIAFEEKGSGGFGYDPLFLPEAFGFEQTLAQVPSDVKNLLSHRANALHKLKTMLHSV